MRGHIYILCRNGSSVGSVNDISERMSKSKKTGNKRDVGVTLNVILAKIRQLLPS